MDVFRILSWISIVFYFANSSGEKCTVSGDPRGTPQEMNNNGGYCLNVFSAMTAAQTGWVTKFDYFAHSDGGTYLSLWRQTAPTSFTLRGKIYFEAETGYQEYIVPFQHQIQVSIGDMFGVHFSETPGTLMYERTTRGYVSTFNDTELSDTYISVKRDGNWQSGHQVTTRTPEKKGVALRVYIDCCSENECARPCPLHCEDNHCDDTSAECTRGCVAGYMGAYCNEVCGIGRYGKNCINECSQHCTSSRTCNSFNGMCAAGGCDAGYHGTRCDMECDFGQFGENCESSCSNNCQNSESVTCNRFAGSCPGGCIEGYHGDQCNIECDFGKYGENCESSCSNNCQNSESVTCNRFDGSCPGGCIVGYYGDQCNIEGCEVNVYGENCSRLCHCINEEPCDWQSGACEHGCASGWQGQSCSVRMRSKKKNEDQILKPNYSAIIGGVLGSIIFLLVILVVVVIRKLRFMTKMKKQNEPEIRISGMSTDVDLPKHVETLDRKASTTDVYDVITEVDTYMRLDENTLPGPEYTNAQPVYTTLEPGNLKP